MKIWKIIKIIHKIIVKNLDILNIFHIFVVRKGNELTITDMTQLVVVNSMTALRANVIARRTGSAAMGVVKAQMIDLLKAKLQSGVAHFVYMKKDGTIREAWGTCAGNLMRTTQNGRGLSGDAVNTVKYYDVMAGGYRSLRYENLVQVF